MLGVGERLYKTLDDREKRGDFFPLRPRNGIRLIHREDLEGGVLVYGGATQETSRGKVADTFSAVHNIWRRAAKWFSGGKGATSYCIQNLVRSRSRRCETFNTGGGR